MSSMMTYWKQELLVGLFFVRYEDDKKTKNGVFALEQMSFRVVGLV